VNKTDPNITVHQSLFGYQDGHRLLASSFPLPEEDASTLLMLSDLAPGLRLPLNEKYWTGTPLPSKNFYALMCTWTAPEMSRPGCVWTHVLMVSFADIARFPDLSILTKYVRRPSVASGFKMFNEPILLTPSSIELTYSQIIDTFDEAGAYQVVRAIYTKGGEGVVVAKLGALDKTIFAIWSQQWPQLRRSFSFRTAVDLNYIRIANGFNLAILLGSNQNYFNLHDDYLNDIETWEKTCVDDLKFTQGTEFRRFLWRYGSDIRLGFTRFKFLTNIYISTRKTKLRGNELKKMLKTIMIELPSPNDGKVLKEDLVISSKYSLLPSANFIEVLAFYLNSSLTCKLPITVNKVIEKILNEWPSRTEEILAIAETAAEHETDLGNKLLEHLMPLIDVSTFFSFTTTRQHLRNRLLILNPSLLDNDDLIKVPSAELLNLINYVPDDDHILIDHILTRLLHINEANLANKTVQLFPDSVIATIITLMELFFTGKGKKVSQSWLEAVKSQSSRILHGGYIENARTTSILSFLASTLGHAQPATLKVGPLPWANALKNIRDDLHDLDRQEILVFLLQLALYNPVSGSEQIFEFAFDSVHADLLHSKLTSEHTSRLLQYLPDLGWLKDWDTCLRLRIGIVDAYVKHNLNQKSFKRLTRNTNLYMDLVDLAKDSEEGRNYLKGVPNK